MPGETHLQEPALAPNNGLWDWLLMAVEIRVFLAVDAFCQKSGRVLAFAEDVGLSHAPDKLLIPNARHLESNISDAAVIPVITIAHAAKRDSWQP